MQAEFSKLADDLVQKFEDQWKATAEHLNSAYKAFVIYVKEQHQTCHDVVAIVVCRAEQQEGNGGAHADLQYAL